ncbi:MAG: hypothetical protein ABI651_12420 [Verrucomicrobiota bacterium]
MQDPIASSAVRVLQMGGPPPPAKQLKFIPQQAQRAADLRSASKTKKKSPNRKVAPQIQLAERLRRLRQTTRETAQAYLLKIDADLGALIKRLGERTEKSNTSRHLKNSCIKQLLKTAKRIDLKPAKGRRKDLRKIEKTVVAMSRIARKN